MRKEKRLRGAVAKKRPKQAPAPPSSALKPAPKPARLYDQPCEFLRTWLWKREAKSDKERFDTPYSDYTFANGAAEQQLVLQQRRYHAEGFASTVWDSAIVLAKLLERRGSFNGVAVELGSGCGLVSTVLALLGARVVATDLEPNLALLQLNLTANTRDAPGTASTAPLAWGRAPAEHVLAELGGSVDLVVATDIMYIHEAVPDLVATLAVLTGAGTTVLLAHGRNRPAEAAFLEAAAQAGLSARELLPSELHPVYQCLDVSVLELRRQP